jgi:hypothetical protein
LYHEVLFANVVAGILLYQRKMRNTKRDYWMNWKLRRLYDH